MVRRLLWSCAAVAMCILVNGQRIAAAQGTASCDSPCKVTHLPLTGPRGAVCDSPCKLINLPLVRQTYASQVKLPFIVRQIPDSEMPVFRVDSVLPGIDSIAYPPRAKLPPFERDIAVSAQPTNNVMPLYPALMHAAQMGGRVVASFVVDTLGRVDRGSFQIVRASQPSFADAVQSATRAVRFVPAVDRDGHKVAQLVRETVDFRWMRGGITQVVVRDNGCTLANIGAFADVPSCASPPPQPPPPQPSAWSRSDNPITWGWTLGGESVTGPNPGHDVPGIALGVLGQFPLSVRRLALRVDGMYHPGFGGDEVCEFSGSPGGSISRQVPPRDCGDSNTGAATLGVDLVARLKDPRVVTSPYLVSGFGFGLPGGHNNIILRNSSLQGGVGLESKPWKTTTFVEVRYMTMGSGGLVVWNFGFRY